MCLIVCDSKIYYLGISFCHIHSRVYKHECSRQLKEIKHLSEDTTVQDSRFLACSSMEADSVHHRFEVCLKQEHSKS